MVNLYRKGRATGIHFVIVSKLWKRSSSIAIEDFTDINPTISQFFVHNAWHSIDDDMNMMLASPFEDISPSYGASGDNKKSWISVNKEKNDVEGWKMQ